MTSEGGGSVAFPVMTLAFNISPDVARDFSMMIQSVGMTAAASAILYMHVHIEWNALFFCTLGGVAGIILGLEIIDPAMDSDMKKMGFVSIWFSFAFSLLLLNRYRKRKTFKSIPDFRPWKAVVLVLTGFMGGIFTSFSGSGLDISSFSILTLLFRVTEKTATPTSVVLMAINSCVGFYWRHAMLQAITVEAWEFMAVCVPVVVLGAPLGSVLGSHFHRQVLAAFVYITDTAALVAAYFQVPPTPLLIGMSVGILLVGFTFFYTLTRLGQKLLENMERNEQLGTNKTDIEENNNGLLAADCSDVTAL